MSKCLCAFTSALTTCRDDAGSTLVSISPTMISALPCRRYALSTLDEAAYCGPMRPAHPLLVPPHLIHAVVVAAAVGDDDFIKLRMEEDAAERTLPTG